jgi:DNA-binding transcriptional LysR family regulator
MGRGIMQLSDRIGRRIKLQDLHVLMTVVQADSMGKAAERLNTSQPNISRSISELEAALGVRLLDRHRQGIEPTEYGRALLDGGVAVFDELRQTVRNIEFLADPTAGEVRIGCNPFLATSFVTAVISRLSLHCPRIVFHLMANRVKALHLALCERSVDLLITQRFGPIEDERMSFEFLFDEPHVVAAGAQSPWVRRRRIELSELVNEPWTLPPPGGVIASLAMEAFAPAGLIILGRLWLLIPPRFGGIWLADGRFLTILQESALRFPTKLPEIKVLPAKLPMGEMPIGVITLKNRTISPVAQLFIENAREVAKPLAKRK